MAAPARETPRLCYPPSRFLMPASGHRRAAMARPSQVSAWGVEAEEGGSPVSDAILIQLRLDGWMLDATRQLGQRQMYDINPLIIIVFESRFADALFSLFSSFSSFSSYSSFSSFHRNIPSSLCILNGR